MKDPSNVAKWFSIVIMLIVATLAILEHFSNQAISFNGFLKKHDAIFLSLGTIISVGLIAICTTYLANKSSERSRRADRIMQSELKIAEFRQKWIDDQRSDIAEFTSLALHRQDGENLIELSDALNRIRLRFNKINPDEAERIERLDQSLQEIMDARSESNADEQIAASERIIQTANEFLKLEWDRLKCDLKKARGLAPPK